MEKSPLRLLDYDVSLMLADQVRISQEVEARRFHLYIYVAPYELPFDMRVLKGTINRVFNGMGRYWGDFWDEEISGKKTITLINYLNSQIRREKEKSRKYLNPISN
jgi:hypothetical protein